MKVCGFTFIRNAEKFDFPVVEAISSVLPVCDFFVVAVGNSADSTRQIIENIDPGKITILDTQWNENLNTGGQVYARETDKAFDAVPGEYDWCFYIQGDEVIHEKYLPVIRKTMENLLDQQDVEGLLFRFIHFYGTYHLVGNSRKWYRNEIRIIRNDKTIRSYRDAQGFRKNGRKLRVVPVDAEVYHYGWVRPPVRMQQKIDEVKKFYDGNSSEQKTYKSKEPQFDYDNKFDALRRFEGTHPRVMEQRIKRCSWSVDADTSKIQMKLRYRILFLIEKRFGIRLFEYRNYTILKGRIF